MREIYLPSPKTCNPISFVTYSSDDPLICLGGPICRREALRRAEEEKQAGDGAGGFGPEEVDATFMSLSECELRRLAAPLCEEDLTHMVDETIMGNPNVGQ